MTRKMTVLAGALALALSGATFAGEKGKNKDELSAEADTTLETGVSGTHGDTVSGYAREQAEERQAMSPPPDSPPGQSISQVAHGQRDWKRLDVDGDGTLSESEINADATLAAELDTFDADADGQLTREEFDAYTIASAEGELSADVDADIDADIDEDID